MEHIDEGLGHKNLRVATLKYLSNHRKHRYKLVDKPKKKGNRIFIDELLAINFFKYLLCVIDVFTKHAWVKTLKDKTVLHCFMEMVN